MSKDLNGSDIFPNDISSRSISDAISSAFNNPLFPKPTSSESSVKKKFRTLREKSVGAKETFVTETEVTEILNEMNREGYTPPSYEEMIKEINELDFGVKSRKKDLEDIKKRLDKCQGDIQTREEGFNGIDKTLQDIQLQSKESKAMLKRFRLLDTFPKDSQDDIS